MHLLYHGLPLARFCAPSPGLAAGAARDGGDRAQPVRLVSVGRLVDKKGYDILLRALALLPQDCHWQLTHIGAGPLAILSFLDDDVIATTIENSDPAYEPFGVKPAQVLAGVKRARAHGYSLDDEDILPGITGIGVPICGGRDDVVASLSVAAISERMRGNRRTNVVAWLKEEAERLERDLGPILSSRAAAGRTMVLGGPWAGHGHYRRGWSAAPGSTR